MKKINKFLFASLFMLGTLAGCGETEEQGPCKTHSWNDGTILAAPTETSTGVITFKCTVCNETKVEIIPATGNTTCEHTWNSGEITTQPTTTSEGVKTFTCTKCGSTKAEVVDKLTEETKFTVSYNANGGTGTAITDLNQYASGDRVTVKGNTFTAPTGKEFINWNEEPDGSGSYHNANSTFRIYENTTLYAQWLDIEEPPIVGPVDDDTEFAIKVNVPTGITYTLSTAKAKKDVEVTLTLAVSGGTSLNGAPTSQQVSLTKVSDLVYKFTMPANAVTINVKGTIDGDVVLTGDLTAKLTDPDNDGIYTTEIACDEKTSYQFTYVVKDSAGEPKRLSSMSLDETRCDADVTYVSGGDNELMVTGGSTYVFSYDSNASKYNCFVTRKTVDVLPMNSKTLFSLFDGKMRSQSTVHPQGLTSIHYEKNVDGNDSTLGYKVTDETYDYKKISDNESFAVSTNNITTDKSYVYKNIDTATDVYSIVNTYTRTTGRSNGVNGNNEASDNVWNIDPYGALNGNRYSPYSAKKDIVEDSKYNNTTRYEITGREAKRNINMAAHYGAALEYEIWQSIRGDFDGTATINAANGAGSHISVTSSKTTNGFKTIVDSQLEYNHIESGSTADVTQQYGLVYSATFEFLANGDLRSLDYSEKFYNKDNWDFSKHTPIAAAVGITTTISVDNGYNENFSTQRETVLNGFNPNDYFISSIDTLSFYNATTGINKSSTESILSFDDKLEIYEYLGGGEPTKIVDKLKFTPETALDAWQYGVVASADAGVVGETPWGYKTVGVGSTNVTFGNHLKNVTGPTKVIPVTCYAGGNFHSLFVNCNIKNYDSFGGDNASNVYGYAGKTMKFYIDSGTNSGCPVSYYMVIKEKNEFGDTTYASTSKYFNFVNSVGTVHNNTTGKDHAKFVGHDLVLDFNTEAANALTKQVTISVTLMSDYYTPGFGPSTLNIIVGPARGSVAGTKYTTTYMYDSTNNPALIGKKYEDATIAFNAGGQGRITELLYTESGDVKYTNIYNFTYTEANNGAISARITSVNCGEPGMPSSASSYSIVIERQLDGSVGVALYTDELDIFGQAMDDGDGYILVENLTKFDKVTD